MAWVNTSSEQKYDCYHKRDKINLDIDDLNTVRNSEAVAQGDSGTGLFLEILQNF